MNIIEKQIDELIPYEINAKRHDRTQIERIAKSLDRYGWLQPCVIDANNVIVVGHGRVLGAKESERWHDKPVPCVLAEDLTEEQIREYRLVDNKLNESEWDVELMAAELSELAADMTEFGFAVGLDEAEDKALDLNDSNDGGDEDSGGKTCHCPKCGFVFEVKL